MTNTKPPKGTASQPTQSRHDLSPQDGAVVVAFPGCTITPVANKPRCGRLPKAVPSLSVARTERQERIERQKAIDASLRELWMFVNMFETCLGGARRLIDDIRAKNV